MSEHASIPGSEPFSFCETVTAGPTTPWHVRRLSPEGWKLSGGADTPALCGRAVSWDLRVEITPHHLDHACRDCAEEFRAQVYYATDRRAARKGEEG